MRRRILALMMILPMGGCAHRQLGRSTILTASSINPIEYGMVLDNIAMFTCEPETLPWHVRLGDGTVQIQDWAGIGQQGGGFTTFNGVRFGINNYGPQGSRRVSLQWGTDAVNDPDQLLALQDIYRRAIGLPPLPEPSFLAALRRARAGDGDRPGSGAQGRSAEARADAVALTISRGGDVPTGWFGVGRKCDVPKDARYVGHYGDRYAWVPPEGVGGLARFTLLVLAIIRPQAGEPAAPGGLMFTP